MDQAQPKSNQDNQNPSKLFCKQPITCPWITNQPYPSTLNKNRASDSTAAKSMPNIPLSMESRTINEKTCPSLQHSSSQFFYFLRLMQLFPETHPATLHTVLCLCKNDFFCAVDKLLYAKRCKALYSRSQGMFKRCSIGRSHPYCGYGSGGKVISQQDKGRSNETMVYPGTKEIIDLHKGSDLGKAQVEGESSLDVGEENNGIPIPLTITSTENHTPTTTTVSSSAFPPTVSSNENNQKTVHTVTSPGLGGHLMQATEICDDKTAEV